MRKLFPEGKKHQDLPGWLIRHKSLSPTMLAGLDLILPEELSKAEYAGLCILVEEVLAGVIPELHRKYPGEALREGAGLCGSLLYPDKGLPADKIKSGRAYLADIAKHTPASLLTFYLRLRQAVREAQLEAAKKRAGIK